METVVEVIGVNGDTVVLAGENTGVDGVWLDTEVEGFYDPEISTVTKSPANRAGTRFISHRVLERTVIFKVTIANDEGPGNTWRERDTRWRRLWAYDRYSTIRVTTDEGSRDLKVRLSEIKVDTYHDPHVNSATSAVMTVVADDPFWYAPDEVYNVTVNGSATIRVPYANPTGNPVFPVWVLEAPGQWTIPDYSAEEPGKMVQLPNLPSATSHLVVDSDPAARQLAAADNTPVWARMNGVRFRNPIEPWTWEVSFNLSVVSDAPRSAQLRLKRPFDRPWGGV